MIALEANDLFRFFHSGDEETIALRGVSLAVAAGELVAVTGPSGSGKSTLLACLSGIDEPDGGVVRVAGETVSHKPEADRARLRALHIGTVAQSANLIEHLTVEENVALVQRLSGRVDRSRCASVIARLELSARARSYPSQLSGGEAARAGMAVAMANDPALLLADEPTGEVDSAAEANVLRLLRQRAEEGGAVVVVTHSDTVASAADRVVALVDGQVVP
ncbi:MAG: putative transport system ATP-binding protein [Actinomycetota bacterium]